jgi:hypothetical protein
MVTDMNEMVRTKTSAKEGFGWCFSRLTCRALQHTDSHTHNLAFVGCDPMLQLLLLLVCFPSFKFFDAEAFNQSSIADWNVSSVTRTTDPSVSILATAALRHPKRPPPLPPQ